MRVRLTPAAFDRYPPEGRAFVLAHIDLLEQIPLALLPILLLQMQRYDYSFPSEKEQLKTEIATLQAMDRTAFGALMQRFQALPMPAELVHMNWINNPQQFSQRLTAWLWSQHLIDAYHAAAESYSLRVHSPSAQALPSVPRCTFVLLGHGIERSDRTLFRRLAPHGTLFTNVDPTQGLQTLLAEASSRAQRFPLTYGHWYIDGGAALQTPGLTTVAYDRLVPAARKEFDLLHRFSSENNSSSLAAVEAVSGYVASLTPEDIGLRGLPADAPIRHFEVSLLTQGAGCQIFSTTFVQWAARECLHRAQPLTLLARFATRQTNAPMEQLLARDPLTQPQDEQGSLVDADMGAYYTWINQSRLPGSDRSLFLAWWEDHDIALAISPTLPRGATSAARGTIQHLLTWMS